MVLIAQHTATAVSFVTFIAYSCCLVLACLAAAPGENTLEHRCGRE
jgi:hypothetical protein